MQSLYAPEDEGHMLQVKSYVEHEPEADYDHAPAEALEAFRAMKYGVRIHWGLYTLWHLRNESWPFLRMSRQRRQAYQQLYHQFNPQNFDAERWMAFFEQVGFKCFAITTKHHEGFSLFDTQTRVRRRVNWLARGGPQIEPCDLAYSVMDTPFRRDIIGELCAAAQRHAIKTDLYFSHPDWYDADFRPYSFHPLLTQRMFDVPEEYGDLAYVAGRKQALDAGKLMLAPEPSLEEVQQMMRRHRQQLVELLTRYGKIDMLCLDMWLGKPVWPELRQTIKLLRQIQPEVMLRIRGIGNYGDYYTPEGFVPAEMAKTEMPWMVIYPLGRTFSYEPLVRHHKNAAWVIRNLVQCTAAGGNFMVGIGPDADGWFHPKTIEILETVGAWLQVNGEAIFNTCPRLPWREGEDIFFSRTADGRRFYALLTGQAWKDFSQGKPLRLDSVPAQPMLQAALLGQGAVLAWELEDDRPVLRLPQAAGAALKRLGWPAGVIRFEV